VSVRTHAHTPKSGLFSHRQSAAGPTAENPGEPNLFKTGSRGFFGMGKIQIGEKRYQVQVQLVEIGSKPKPEEKALKP